MTAAGSDIFSASFTIAGFEVSVVEPLEYDFITDFSVIACVSLSLLLLFRFDFEGLASRASFGCAGVSLLNMSSSSQTVSTFVSSILAGATDDAIFGLAGAGTVLLFPNKSESESESSLNKDVIFFTGTGTLNFFGSGLKILPLSETGLLCERVVGVLLLKRSSSDSESSKIDFLTGAGFFTELLDLVGCLLETILFDDDDDMMGGLIVETTFCD